MSRSDARDAGRDISPDELEAQEGRPLPDRAAMSVVDLGGGDPGAVTLPVEPGAGETLPIEPPAES